MTPEQAAKNKEKCKQYRARKKAKLMLNKTQNEPEVTEVQHSPSYLNQALYRIQDMPTPDNLDVSTKDGYTAAEKGKGTARHEKYTAPDAYTKYEDAIMPMSPYHLPSHEPNLDTSSVPGPVIDSTQHPVNIDLTYSPLTTPSLVLASETMPVELDPVTGELPLVPAFTLDYTRFVHGFELSEKAPVVKWPGGVKTVLPFIPKDGDETTNVLKLDELAVIKMAEMSLCEPVEFVVSINHKSLSLDDMETKVRYELGRGNTVVIENFEDPEPYAFSENRVVREQGLNLQKVYSVHNIPAADKWTPKIIRRVSQHVRRLNDGQKARVGTRGIVPELYTSIDTFDSENWDLIHGAGAHTMEHHDAEGLCTFIYMKTGVKMWGIVRPDGFSEAETEQALKELNERFVRPSWVGDAPESWALPWEEMGGKVYTIIARPGSLVIMPPGTWHLVYTPVRTVACGGHFYNYDTLHLTEASRHYDKTRASQLYAAWVPLPDNPKLRDALGEEIRHKLGLVASLVGESVAASLGLDIQKRDFLFKNGSWMDPGSPIDLSDALKEWENTPVRPGYSHTTTQSIDDLLKSKSSKSKKREAPPIAGPSSKRPRRRK
ncbi:hypothetical protein BDZ94DRAFT_1237583 [Collybia nuda]|uniref:JmjC domain-containing protein n=1 Tax=Collybia nuda TaxID=64659 RepID=A0A9P5Y1A0_9AGAR|nr:hypothetical protein BDZ94DRAFT_1237583 [Collybia nuda]